MQEVESNRIIIWRMNPVTWEGDGQVCVGTLVVINCGALRRVDEGCRTGHFNSNNRLDLGRGKGKSDRVIDEGYNGP